MRNTCVNIVSTVVMINIQKSKKERKKNDQKKCLSLWVCVLFIIIYLFFGYVF